MEEQIQNKIELYSLKYILLEKEIEDIKKQIVLYVPLRENDVQLKGIQDDADRLEDRLEKHMIEAIRQLGEINTKLFEQAAKTQAQRENQTALQIKVLWGTISLVIGLLTSVLAGYIMHLFH